MLNEKKKLFEEGGVKREWREKKVSELGRGAPKKAFMGPVQNNHWWFRRLAGRRERG